MTVPLIVKLLKTSDKEKNKKLKSSEGQRTLYVQGKKKSNDRIFYEKPQNPEGNGMPFFT